MSEIKYAKRVQSVLKSDYISNCNIVEVVYGLRFEMRISRIDIHYILIDRR